MQIMCTHLENEWIDNLRESDIGETCKGRADAMFLKLIANEIAQAVKSAMAGDEMC